MTRSVVVSGPPAVGKTTVARALAERFGLEYVSGGDVLKGIAAESGFAPGGDDWWDTSEGMRFLEARAGNDEYDRRVDAALAGRYRGGGVALTSYTLPWIERGPGGVKVWLSGSPESSASRMQARDGMGAGEAAAVARRRYDANRALYRRLYGFEFGEDLSVFDVVIGTDGAGAGEVISRAREAVGKLL